MLRSCYFSLNRFVIVKHLVCVRENLCYSIKLYRGYDRGQCQERDIDFEYANSSMVTFSDSLNRSHVAQMTIPHYHDNQATHELSNQTFRSQVWMT